MGGKCLMQWPRQRGAHGAIKHLDIYCSFVVSTPFYLDLDKD